MRKDMQCLHDETRAAFNALVEELTDGSAAAQIGVAALRGFAGRTVQAVLQELAGAVGELGGGLEVDGSALAEIVAAAVERELLGEYYTAPQVEEKLAALGVGALEERMDSIENALSSDGVVLGEVPAAYPFTLPAAELAGAAELLGSSPAAWINGELVAVAASKILRVQPAEGKMERVSLRGDTIPSAAVFRTIWEDGGYMIGEAAGAWYLVSIKTGVCVLLNYMEGCTFCGAALVGNIIAAMFHRGSVLYFVRRSIAGDSGASPALTALDAYSENGSAYDRVLNVWNGMFVMLKYRAEGSVLKVYNAADMSGSAEYAVGSAARAHSIRTAAEDCFFILEVNSRRNPARCRMAEDSDPVITVGGSIAERIIAGGENCVFAAEGRRLLRLDRESMASLEVIELPDDIPAIMDGAPLAELWGGDRVLAGSRLLNVENKKTTALRCDGAEPEEFALMPAVERCFAARANGRWYVFDSLLRPLWGMVPYVAGGAV